MQILIYLFFFLLSFSRLTCAFLACKVDEFNVSSVQFVGNLRESPLGQEKALEQILEYELLLIQQLNFHLIVHNPYRPFEGFLIDIKVIMFYVLHTSYANVRRMLRLMIEKISVLLMMLIVK